MARRTIEQVDAEARAEFELDLAIGKMPYADDEFLASVQTELHDARVRQWMELHPGAKSPKNVGKLIMDLAEKSELLAVPFKAKVDAHVVARRKARDEAEARMRELAPDIILHHQPDGRTWIEVERVSDSCYSNQTQSKHYTR